MCNNPVVRVSGRVVAGAVLVTVLSGIVGLDAAAGAPVDQIERVRKRVLDDAYQPELPRYGSGDAARAPGDRGDAHQQRRPRVDARLGRVEAGGSQLVTVLMWGGLIVVAVLLAAWLAGELSRHGGDAELPGDDRARQRQAATDAIVERPLEDAEDLARRGRFAEAIHTLLLRTLGELARSAAVRVAPAMTSREILARVPLLADARSALSGLIAAVELTHFGDEPANAADYERCRQQFGVFAAAFRQGSRGDPRAVAGAVAG
jgi:hypothetical protein